MRLSKARASLFQPARFEAIYAVFPANKGVHHVQPLSSSADISYQAEMCMRKTAPETP